MLVPTRFGGIFELEKKQQRLKEVKSALEDPHVWQNPAQSQELGRERSQLEKVVTVFESLESNLTDAQELLALVVEENDEAGLQDVIKEIVQLEKQVAELEFQRMFSGEMDAQNAFVDINSGSGGTEAQDWAEMLLRMYLRWC